MNRLPSSILERAFCASNGEYAWRRADLPRVCEAIVAAKLAIVGGEAWAIMNGQIHAAIPRALGGPAGVWTWSTRPRATGESWSAFCARTAQESVDTIAGMNAEADARGDFKAHIFFNLCYVSERDA